MKTFYLLRHAKAEAGGKEISDPERRLSARGREACAQMGAYMKEKSYIPEQVCSSTSARTRETLEQVAMAWGKDAKARFEDRLYLASAEEILSTARQTQDGAGSLLLIGHNPGMHHAALLLSEPRRSELRSALELKFPTCALAVLRFDVGHWAAIAPGEGKLVDFIAPGEL